MTDGPTGFQVAPITEDEMSKVHAILQRAADAIVGMSQLTADVASLRQTVTELQADTERLRNQNIALDEALNHSRSVRDEQAQKIAALSTKADDAEHKAATIQAEYTKMADAAQALQAELSQARKDRDDAQFEVLDLKDKLAAAEGKLAKLAELHRSIFNEPVDKPEPQPQPAPTDHYSEPAPAPTPAEPDPWAPVQPTKPRRVDRWEPGYYWDGVAGCYRLDE